MAKKAQNHEPADILRGHTITVVAIKAGETRTRDMEYTAAVQAKKKFDRAGWKCLLYQAGFYQGKKSE